MNMTASKSRNVFVDLLFVIFGWSSWISMNGVFIESPVLVDVLPERWNIPSYVTLVAQLANIYPLVYGILHINFPKRVRVTRTLYFILIQGLISSFLLIFLWDKTAIINGKSRSIGLFTILFFLAMVDCTSSVTFLPFVSKFKSQYVITYLIGEGLSGFLPAIVALGQGVGGNPECKNVSFTNITTDGNFTQWHLETEYGSPRFSATVFFGILFIMVCGSAVAFLLLNYHRIAKAERTTKMGQITNISSSELTAVTTQCSINESSSSPSINGNLPVVNVSVKAQPGRMKRFTFWYLLSVQTFSSFLLFGFLTSIQSFSCLPYGNSAFHLSVVFSNTAMPLASIVALFIVPVNVTVVTINVVIGTLFSGYIFATAAMSPTPPLVYSRGGTALIVIVWSICYGLVAYARVGVANILRSQGERALFWLGAGNEIGALIGAVVSFLLVNAFQIFESYSPCE